MLKPVTAISDSYKSYPFLCNSPKKCAVTWLLRCKHQSPNRLFLVSHQVFYLHPMLASTLFLADRYFSLKNSTNVMSGGSMLIIHCCTRAFSMLCSRETCLLALHSSLCLSGTSLVSYMKKEITVIYSISEINAGGWWKTNNQCIGSYMAIKSSQAGQVRPEQFYANQTCTWALWFTRLKNH